MQHVMIDLETLGVKTDAVIISIAAVKFDPVSGMTEEPFFSAVDIQSCLDIGLRIESGSLRFWLNQPAEIREVSMPEDAKYLEHALDWLDLYVEGCTQFWAYGPMFDIAKLDYVYEKMSRRPVWTYRQPRCVRTILDVASVDLEDFPAPRLHDPVADCEQQIAAVHAAYRKLGLVPLN